MKVSSLFYGWFAVLLLFSCKDGGKTASFLGEGGDTLDLKYAENLKIVSYDDYRVATLRNPWDTLEILHTYVLVGRDEPLPDSLPQGTVVRVPLPESCHLFVCALRVDGRVGGTGCRGWSVRPPLHRPALHQGGMPHGAYRGFGQRDESGHREAHGVGIPMP